MKATHRQILNTYCRMGYVELSHIPGLELTTMYYNAPNGYNFVAIKGSERINVKFIPILEDLYKHEEELLNSL